MALINYATKEITVKIVYYGPGLSGKTTNLQFLHASLNPDKRGKLLSLATEADRTLFFDLLPIDLGKIKDFSIRFQLYTVPGQVRYNATRRIVLKGADAIVFVADSQTEMRGQNIESLNNMRENLTANNISPEDIPMIFQYNKRDLPNILSIDELNNDLNESVKYEYIGAVAIDGTGVEDSFRRISKLAIDDIGKRQSAKLQPIEEVYESPIEVEPEQGIKSSMYDFSELTEQTIYKPIDIKELHNQIDIEKETTSSSGVIAKEVKEVYNQIDIEKEATPSSGVIAKEIKEVPVIPEEKFDLIIRNLNKLSHNLTEIKNVLKDAKKEQKETNVLLRDIRNYFDKMKVKKSWFRF